MKTKLIFLVLLIVCISCGTNNKPVSDAQKEKIIGEVKEAVNTIVSGAEEANFNKVSGLIYDSPDFVALFNGNSFTYQQFADMGKSVFSTLKNQKSTIIDEKYLVIDNSTVLYTANSKWLMYYKDGHAVAEDPWAMQYVFKKIDNNWKVISFNESGVEKAVARETSKEINQVEFMQQFLGTWRAEYGKDTILIYNARPFGMGSERDWSLSTKGKIITSAKVLFGYDSKSDIQIAATLYKSSPEIEIWTWRATSKNTAEGVPIKDITNPDNAVAKMKTELKSPDLAIFTNLVNNKVVGTYTWTRVGK